MITIFLRWFRIFFKPEVICSVICFERNGSMRFRIGEETGKLFKTF